MYITSTDRLYIQKYFTDVADATAADDRFEVSTPSNQKLVIDEDGADTALWNAAGVTFYTADSGEFFDLSPSDIGPSATNRERRMTRLSTFLLAAPFILTQSRSPFAFCSNAGRANDCEWLLVRIC